MTEHFLEVCACGRVLKQCRCPGQKPVRVRAGPCACAQTGSPLSSEQTREILREISEITALVKKLVDELMCIDEALAKAKEDAINYRARLDDAELLVRAMFDARLNGRHAFDWHFQADGTISFPGRFVLPFNRKTGLPELTAEARTRIRQELAS